MAHRPFHCLINHHPGNAPGKTESQRIFRKTAYVRCPRQHIFKVLRDFFFTLDVSVFLQCAAIYLKIAGVIADHISFSQMVFFMFMFLQNVLIDDGLISGAILKRFLCCFFKSPFFIKFPRCKSVCKKTHTIRSIAFCPIQKLCDQYGSQTLSVISFGRKGNEFQIACSKDVLIPFLQLEKKASNCFWNGTDILYLFR